MRGLMANPKGAAKLTEVAGRVEIEQDERGPKVTIHQDGLDENGEPLELVVTAEGQDVVRVDRALVELVARLHALAPLDE